MVRLFKNLFKFCVKDLNFIKFVNNMYDALKCAISTHVLKWFSKYI